MMPVYYLGLRPQRLLTKLAILSALRIAFAFVCLCCHHRVLRRLLPLAEEHLIQLAPPEGWVFCLHEGEFPLLKSLECSLQVGWSSRQA